MEEFPVLRSGALVQYPVRRGQGTVHMNVEFWGGGGQSYVRKKANALTWMLKYVGLSEEEVAYLLEFCEKHEESGMLFSFRDPIEGTLYDHCRVEPDSIEAVGDDVNSYEFGATIIRVEV